jgi:hypothetical protein
MPRGLSERSADPAFWARSRGGLSLRRGFTTLYRSRSGFGSHTEEFSWSAVSGPSHLDFFTLSIISTRLSSFGFGGTNIISRSASEKCSSRNALISIRGCQQPMTHLQGSMLFSERQNLKLTYPPTLGHRIISSSYCSSNLFALLSNGETQ